jgi:hypothetical protein
MQLPKQSPNGCPTWTAITSQRPENFWRFLFSSPDQKVFTKMPRPSLVSHGARLPDLIEISFGDEPP